jgi:hypothetical protein
LAREGDNSNLKFTKYDKEMKDRVKGAERLKPDIAGTQNPRRGKEIELWWMPSTGERSLTMEIPVEVKGNWKELVSQAATYARGLSNAIPLHQFCLVLGYNHKIQELRFLVFHAGGLTTSTGLLVGNSDHCKDILRLFLSLLTWKSAGDAGIPEWGNDIYMFVQRDEDDLAGVKMEVKEVLYDKLAIRGRRQHVVHLWRPVPPSSTPPLLPAPPVIVQMHRRSHRIAKQQEALELALTRKSGEFLTALHSRDVTYFT